jgi:hypothetical protein
MPKLMDESPAIPVSIEVAGEESPGRPPARYSKADEQLMRSRVHYVGFRITDEGREYTLRATNEAPRLFVLLISHQHFQTGRARYQDGPDVCCAKLTRVLMEDALDADLESPLVLTAAELAVYRAGRADPSARRRRARASDTESRN